MAEILGAAVRWVGIDHFGCGRGGVAGVRRGGKRRNGRLQGRLPDSDREFGRRRSSDQGQRPRKDWPAARDTPARQAPQAWERPRTDQVTFLRVWAVDRPVVVGRVVRAVPGNHRTVSGLRAASGTGKRCLR